MSKVTSQPAHIYFHGDSFSHSNAGAGHEVYIFIKFDTAPQSTLDYLYMFTSDYSGFGILTDINNHTVGKGRLIDITIKANREIYFWCDATFLENLSIFTSTFYSYNSEPYVNMKSFNLYQLNLLPNDYLNFTASYVYSCLSPNTKILMADNTEKEIYTLSKGDKILSYNPATMKIEEDEIIYTDSQETKVAGSYDVYTFDDGTRIETVNRHRFYNYEQQKMVYMDEWLIGDHAVTKDGKLTKLVSHIYVPRETKHYTLFTKNQNYFANGLLSGNRNTKELKINI